MAKICVKLRTPKRYYPLIYHFISQIAPSARNYVVSQALEAYLVNGKCIEGNDLPSNGYAAIVDIVTFTLRVDRELAPNVFDHLAKHDSKVRAEEIRHLLRLSLDGHSYGSPNAVSEQISLANEIDTIDLGGLDFDGS